MIDLYKKYYQSIRWNTFESLFYQLFLLAHQFALFTFTDKSTYGLIGAIFSATYLLVMVANFGLDVSISAFFTRAVESKKHFKKIILFQLIPEYCILAIAGGVALLSSQVFMTISMPFQLDKHAMVVLGLLIVFEGSKKTFRSILQLGFHSNKTAVIEVATIIGYICMVWIGYLKGHPIDFMLVFLPLLIVSIASNIALLIFLNLFYQKLPETSDSPLPTSALQWRILRNRFFNFLNQATHALFSSNFLVPFFAVTFGLAHAGVLKLTASIAHCITSIVQKIFGISGSVLLAHLKESSLEIRQKAFFTINNRLNQVLYGFIIFFTINHAVIIKARALSQTTTIITLAYLFMIIIFSESFFLAYEKFYITDEKSDYLFFFNLSVMAIIGLLLTQAQTLSHLALMTAIIAVRFISFFGMTIFSFYRWRLKPALTIQPHYFITSLTASLIFFICMN